MKLQSIIDNEMPASLHTLHSQEQGKWCAPINMCSSAEIISPNKPSENLGALQSVQEQ